MLNSFWIEIWWQDRRLWRGFADLLVVEQDLWMKILPPFGENFRGEPKIIAFIQSNNRELVLRNSPLITVSKWRTIWLNSQPISSAKLLKYLPREAIPRYTRVRLRFPPSAFLVDRRKSKSWRDFLSQKATTMRWKISFWMSLCHECELVKALNTTTTDAAPLKSLFFPDEAEQEMKLIVALSMQSFIQSWIHQKQDTLFGLLFQATNSWLLYPRPLYTFKWMAQ